MKPVWISTSIEGFMMRTNDGTHRLDAMKRRTDLIPNDRVLPDLVEFTRCERSGFKQDGVTNRDLAEIM